MQCKSEDVRKRIRSLCLEISSLQMAARRNFSRSLAQEIAIRQAELSGYKLLMWSRHVQLNDQVVELARWRDGVMARSEPMTRRPHSEPLRAVGA